ncbi:unnamed protein product [Cunninghamella blakesleeana]
MVIFNKVGIHWHLWRMRRLQRSRPYATGSSYNSYANKNVIDSKYLNLFPTRIIGDNNSNTNNVNIPTENKNNETNNNKGDTTTTTHQSSILVIRTERALENAEALAATIVHPKRISKPASIINTSLPTNTVSPETQLNNNNNNNTNHPDCSHSCDIPPSNSNDLQNETQASCVICLDEYTNGENVRRLPCGHEYHVECIDPWLTIKSASCPLCKYDCSLDIPKRDIEGLTNNQNLDNSEESISRGSSTFSLSILRRYMDNDSHSLHSSSRDINGLNNNNNTDNNNNSNTISAFGPTIPIDQAEAFSRTWMARSLPRNMRRQIDLAVAAQRRENASIELPVRMTIAPPEPALIPSSSSNNNSSNNNPVTLDMPTQLSESPNHQQANHKKSIKSLLKHWQKN